MTIDLQRIGTGLPFATSLPALRAALLARGVAVVQAPPGTGKTTLVPPLLADLYGDDRVVVTQPRRVAARAAARRLAALTDTAVGDLVGYTVRGERQVGPRTRIEMVTPGVLVRRLLTDPELPGVAAVALDEVHERSLDTDLLIGMLGEVRELRPELALVAMSATLDAARFAGLLGPIEGPAAPLVDCPSALYPLRVEHQPAAGPRTDARGVTRDFLRHVATIAVDALRRELRDEPTTDALVFVPGAGEVAAVARAARELAPEFDVVELHGQIAPRVQDRIVSGRVPGEAARLVVSTSIAESSLTVPGVRLVVDAGLSREPRRDTARGMSGLVTVTCSRASADQRAGRAARQRSGVVVRCYDEATDRRLPAQPTPQIATADLTGSALTLACWGAPRGEGLRTPDPPPAGAIADAERTLHDLGAVDEAGRITAEGRRLAVVPVEPRLARALIDGADVVGATTAAEVVAMLSADLRADGGDLDGLLRELRSGRHHGTRTWAADAARLAALTSAHPVAGSEFITHAIGFVVALAAPERVARRSGDSWLLASGTRAGLPPGSPLAQHEWLAVADVTRAQGKASAGTGAVIRAAAALDQATAELAAAHLVGGDLEVSFDGARLTARRVERLGAIVVSQTPTTAPADRASHAIREWLQRNGIGALTWPPAADQARRRLALLHRVLGDPWPAVDDGTLLARIDDWLGPDLDRVAHGARLDGVDLESALRRLLPWPQAARLDALAPERLAVPSGSRARIDYPALDEPDGRPVVAVKLQECFGWAETPRLVDGRVPILFHLLSPARRPVAVTDDLASFWAGPYAQVRAELRGRYPKHPWPQDPWTAPPTARTTRAGDAKR